MGTAINLRLVLDPPVLNSIGFYPPKKNGSVIQTGFLHPFKSRRNVDRQFNFTAALLALLALRHQLIILTA